MVFLTQRNLAMTYHSKFHASVLELETPMGIISGSLGLSIFGLDQSSWLSLASFFLGLRS